MFWPGDFRGLYSPWGCKESDATKWLSPPFTFSPFLLGFFFIIINTSCSKFVTFFFLGWVFSIAFFPHTFISTPLTCNFKNDCVCVCVCVCVLVAELCLTLWDPTDCSPLGSFVYRILQARIQECVAILFSRGSSQPNQRSNPCLPHCRQVF